MHNDALILLRWNFNYPKSPAHEIRNQPPPILDAWWYIKYHYAH